MEYIVPVICVAAILYLFLIAPGGTCVDAKEWVKGHNFAHRGYYNEAAGIPENSIAAFARAKEAGYGVEFDVQLTKDDVVVVFHDDSLLRMCGKDVLLVDLTFEELQTYRLQGTSEKIPTLAEVLTLLEEEVPFYIEIKNFKIHCERLCERTLWQLQKQHGRFGVCSFNPFALQYFRRHAPQLLRMQIAQKSRTSKISDIQKVALQYLCLNFVSRPHAISYEYNETNIAFRICRLLGALTMGWSVPSKDDYTTYKALFDSVIFEHFAAPIKDNGE